MHLRSAILLQSYISQAPLDNFALVSDSYFVTQSAGRVARALFEIVLKRGWPAMAQRMLTVAKMIDKRVWDFQHPLRQMGTLPLDVLDKLEGKSVCHGDWLSVCVFADVFCVCVCLW